MFRFLCVALVAIASVSADHPHHAPHHAPHHVPHHAPAPYHPAPYHPPKYDEAPKPYAYQYGVHDDYSGANFNAQETADGKAVHGSYQVHLPDGRVQTVTYTADHYNGYVADVKYDGKPIYAEHKPYHPAPAYHKPAPYHPAPAPYHPAPIVHHKKPHHG